MAFLPQRLLRLTGFTSTYLTSTAGSNGEIYYDSTTKSLRVYDGGLKGGYQLARSDLTNITNTAFANKATAAGVGLAPTWTSIVGKPAWTNTPFIKVAADDSTVRLVNLDETIVISGANGITTASDSEGEITITGPNLAVVATTGNYTDLSNRPNLATVATSGSYTDLTNTPAPVSLTGYATESFVNTQISNLVDGAPGVLNTLNELAAAINDDSTFAGTVFAALDAKASLDSPQFTGTVSVNNLEISGLVSPSYETITPTGSVEATAAAITKNTVVIPTGSNTGGVRLPAGALGTRILIRNNSSSTHYVYAPPGQVVAGGFGGPDAITMAVLKEYLYLETGVWTVVTH